MTKNPSPFATLAAERKARPAPAPAVPRETKPAAVSPAVRALSREMSSPAAAATLEPPAAHSAVVRALTRNRTDAPTKQAPQKQNKILLRTSADDVTQIRKTLSFLTQHGRSGRISTAFRAALRSVPIDKHFVTEFVRIRNTTRHEEEFTINILEADKPFLIKLRSYLIDQGQKTPFDRVILLAAINLVSLNSNFLKTFDEAQLDDKRRQRQG